VSACLPGGFGGGRLGVPGDGVLTWEESKAHLALYAVTSSPLILGNGEQNARPAQLTHALAQLTYNAPSANARTCLTDPREGFMQQRLVDLLLNPDMLRVNQLWAGFAGDRVWSKPVGRECWAKPLGGLAVAVPTSQPTEHSRSSSSSTRCPVPGYWGRLPGRAHRQTMMRRPVAAHCGVRFLISLPHLALARRWGASPARS
jgi:hypothetical protein